MVPDRSFLPAHHPDGAFLETRDSAPLVPAQKCSRSVCSVSENENEVPMCKHLMCVLENKWPRVWKQCSVGLAGMRGTAVGRGEVMWGGRRGLDSGAGSAGWRGVDGSQADAAPRRGWPQFRCHHVELHWATLPAFMKCTPPLHGSAQACSPAASSPSRTREISGTHVLPCLFFLDTPEGTRVGNVC